MKKSKKCIFLWLGFRPYILINSERIQFKTSKNHIKFILSEKMAECLRDLATVILYFENIILFLEILRSILYLETMNENDI